MEGEGRLTGYDAIAEEPQALHPIAECVVYSVRSPCTAASNSSASFRGKSGIRRVASEHTASSASVLTSRRFSGRASPQQEHFPP